MQAVDLYDRLHMCISKRDLLTTTDAALRVDRSNLIWKSVDLFRKMTGINFKVECHLEKIIPMEAGLGGGSSNAAAALWGMNALAGFPVSVQKLMDFGASIGSDVPFFFSIGTAYCKGRGESVEPLVLPKACVNNNCDILAPPQEMWLIKQHTGLSTAAVYGALQISSLNSRDPLDAVASFKTGIPVYFNDLEQPAYQLMPCLVHLKEQLLGHGFDHVLLAGSGSTLIGFGSPGPEFHSQVVGMKVRVKSIARKADSWYEDN